MNEEFQRLRREMCGEPQISYGRLQQIFKEIWAIGDTTDDLLSALQEEIKTEHWRCVNLLVILIHRRPDPRFTPLLCELIDDYREHTNLEDVAETLEYIKDERSVPSLIRILNYYAPGDDARHLNKKVISALARIGTSEAIRAIDQASSNEDEQIRETAKKELARLRTL